MPYVRHLQGRSLYVRDEDCAILRLPLTAPRRAHLNYAAQLCYLVVYVTHDRDHVFVGDGEVGSSIAREADEVEIEALTERFGLPELRQALERRQRTAPQ